MLCKDFKSNFFPKKRKCFVTFKIKLVKIVKILVTKLAIYMT